MWVRRSTLGLALGLAACAAEKERQDELAMSERGRVVRFPAGGALGLNTDQCVRLVSIEAPAAPERDREGEAGPEEAKQTLKDVGGAALRRPDARPA